MPTTSRQDLADWILVELGKMDRAKAMVYILAYFTTVDLDLIKQDMLARKELDK